MRTKDVKVLTTELNGVKIEEYLQPVTAHVIVDIDFSKDSEMSTIDISNEESSRYEETLSEINNKVIEKIKKRAFDQGADYVIGLKIDNDEISAQGKSMLMVTAIGTPVRAKLTNKLNKTYLPKSYNSLNPEQLDFFQKQKSYLKRIDKEPSGINDGIWDFATVHSQEVFMEHLLDSYIHALSCNCCKPEYFNTFTRKLKDYSSSLEKETISDAIYTKLQNHEYGQVVIGLCEVLKNLSLIDYKHLLELIKNEDPDIKHEAYELLCKPKHNYIASDIALIRKIIKQLPIAFPPRPQNTIILNEKQKSQSLESTIDYLNSIVEVLEERLKVGRQSMRFYTV